MRHNGLRKQTALDAAFECRDEHYIQCRLILSNTCHDHVTGHRRNVLIQLYRRRAHEARSLGRGTMRHTGRQHNVYIAFRQRLRKVQ